MLDPFPGKELIDRSEVRRLMGMERTTFERWLETEDARMFPRPITIGHTAKAKKPIQKWKKSQVFAFIDLLRP